MPIGIRLACYYIAIAELGGCYCVYRVCFRNASRWWLLPALMSLGVAIWMLNWGDVT